MEELRFDGMRGLNLYGAYAYIVGVIGNQQAFELRVGSMTRSWPTSCNGYPSWKPHPRSQHLLKRASEASQSATSEREWEHCRTLTKAQRGSGGGGCYEGEVNGECSSETGKEVGR
jgi:hypothetical protein